MAWKTNDRGRVEAVAYTRNFSASSVFDELKTDGGESFSDEPEFINYYDSTGWKVYKVTIVIEPVDSYPSE
jgi:hypothetical protein